MFLKPGVAYDPEFSIIVQIITDQITISVVILESLYPEGGCMCKAPHTRSARLCSSNRNRDHSPIRLTDSSFR